MSSDYICLQCGGLNLQNISVMFCSTLCQKKYWQFTKPIEAIKNAYYAPPALGTPDDINREPVLYKFNPLPEQKALIMELVPTQDFLNLIENFENAVAKRNLTESEIKDYAEKLLNALGAEQRLTKYFQFKFRKDNAG